MSIASEIQDLQNNLESAKSAVTAKGGTVGDTGLAGLATEIASIPSGGSADWGTVTYLDSNDQPQTVNIRNLKELESLGGSSDTWTCSIDGVSISNTKITGVTLGKDAILTPAYFLRGCVNLSSVNVPYLEYTGTNFLHGCGASLTRLELPSVKEIGNFFMSAATADCDIVLSNNLTKIGTYFLNLNGNRNKPIVFPQTLTSIGTGPFCMNNSMTSYIDVGNLPASIVPADATKPSNPAFSAKLNTDPAYTIGMEIRGSTASDWMAKFPNGPITGFATTSYRNLRLGEGEL